MNNLTIKTLLAFLLVAILSACSNEDKPNIVVFLADDMGWGDSGCYGSEKILSPNIDKLASQGIRFTQAYSACGVCSPSRSAIRRRCGGRGWCRSQQRQTG